MKDFKKVLALSKALGFTSLLENTIGKKVTGYNETYKYLWLQEYRQWLSSLGTNIAFTFKQMNGNATTYEYCLHYKYGSQTKVTNWSKGNFEKESDALIQGLVESSERFATNRVPVNPILGNRIVSDYSFARRLGSFLDTIYTSCPVITEEVEYLNSVAGKLLDYQLHTCPKDEQWYHLNIDKSLKFD